MTDPFPSAPLPTSPQSSEWLCFPSVLGWFVAVAGPEHPIQ